MTVDDSTHYGHPHPDMSTIDETWTKAHDLALIYIGLAYGTDYDLADAELATITDTLGAWCEDLDRDALRELVMEALSVFLDGRGRAEVSRSMHALGDSLTPAERQRALDDIVRIAAADGVILDSEQSMISSLATLWGLKAETPGLVEALQEPASEEEDWSLAHDIGLMYVVLAHSTDNELSNQEITAMIARMKDWKADWTEETVRTVLRTALEVYAQEPGREVLARSVETLKHSLPLIQRLALLDDLVYIAEVDGGLNDNEKEMIASLAQAWDVGIRVNGRVSVMPR